MHKIAVQERNLRPTGNFIGTEIKAVMKLASLVAKWKLSYTVKICGQSMRAAYWSITRVIPKQ